ncbi:MAG: hypothetical protein MIO93_10215 [ANME-2 cluster archaeon]|jgi:hypothetical protein|nr:hypothetical protein [ANME-2 cluster archaeon]
MFPNKIDSAYIERTIKRICQGDILRDVSIIDWNYEKEIIELDLPYIIVMTQDCDLERDFYNRSQINPKTHDKFLQNILVSPAYDAMKFRDGHHLKKFELTMENWNSDNYKRIKDQNNARFHFLESCLELQVPELVIDFKHYYTIPRETLYKMYADHYLATINQLFRECLSQRFASYLSRIGLPVLEKRTDSKSTLPTASTS